MSNGRREGHYGSYSSYNAYQPHQQHQQQHQQQQSGRRNSFESGDDQHLGVGNNQAPQQGSYQAYGQNQQHSSQSPDLRTQGYGGYPGPPQQYNPSSQSTYNPASYAQQSPQLMSGSHVQMPAGNYAAAVPYNPASYQNPSPQPPQSGFGYQAYGSAPVSSYSQGSNPPLPPKPPELSQSPSTQYSRPAQDWRGAAPTASPVDNQTSYPNHSPSVPYSAYTPPAAPPRPPSHGSVGASPNVPQYQAYSPPQNHQAAPPPPQHRRLPSIPQGAMSPPLDNNSSTSTNSRAPLRGASLPTAGQGRSNQANNGRSNSSSSASSRPLPAPPGGNVQTNGNTTAENTSYDDIFAEVEAAVMGRPGSIGHAASQTNHIGQGSSNGVVGLFPNRTSSQGHGHDYFPDNGHAGAETAVSGVERMRLNEEDDANIARNTSYRSTATTAVPPDGSDVSRNTSYRSTNTVDSNTTVAPGLQDVEDEDSDDGAVPIDISLGFDPGMNFSYGGNDLGPPTILTPPIQSPPLNQAQSPPPPPLPQRPSSGSVQQQTVQYVWAHSGEALNSPRSTARVDQGVTGGNVAPGERRMSFDEDDEAAMVGYEQQRPSGSSSPVKGGSGIRRAGSRPLPPPPQDENRLSPNTGHDRYPQGPDHYDSSHEGPENVRKTNSLNYTNHHHATNNQHLVPGRSITDAEQRRRQGVRSSFYVDSKEPAFSSPDLELPTIPDGRRRKFVPSKLSTKDYALCQEPWAISSVLAWLVEITDGESDLKKQPIVDALVGLFTHKVPTMNIADAEVLGASLVQEMIHEAALVKEEEWIKFSGVKMSGVIYQLTGTGCYSSKVHTIAMSGRCYSHHCMRTLKKIDLQAQQLPPEKATEDWMTFYKLSAEDLKDIEHKEIELQNNLHEIVTSEDYFVDQLDVLLVLYRDGLAKSAQPIIALTGKQGKFISDVFDKVPAVKKANEDYLLSPLKYRQQEQGPWLRGVSDIFREWIRRAKGAYIDYAYNLPNAVSQMNTQLGANPLFRQFLDQVREHPRSKRLDWNTYLKAPVVRLQRYSLLLDTVRKNMRKESQAKEKANIEKAIEEIREVTRECDAKVDEMTKRTEMLELSTKLKLRPGMEDVQLNLNHLGRQIVHRGDLVRRGNNSINWVESHIILFDHFMILSKPVRNKDNAGAVKSEIYDVSKLPIPMDLLVLESADDIAVTKHSVRGIIPITTTQVAQPKAPPTPDLRLTKTNTGQGSSGAPQATRSNSTPSVGAAASPGVVENENVMFPFRIQHLGKSEVYVLYAPSAKARQEWADAIVLAKKQHAAALYQQNAEPFRLRVLADTAFAYSVDSAGGLPVHIPGTPLDRAIRDIEREHPLPAQIQPVCRSVVNCATTFTPHFSDRVMLAVGTDFGVFITDNRAPRSWYKAINAVQVSQIQVLEDFNVLLIIADKALIAFHLDAVVPTQGSNASDSSKRTPQKLSGSRDVGYFAVGRMKERMLVFYKKKDGISSTFKVLEPVYHKSATTTSTGSGWGRSRFGLKKGATDFFRDFDDFYIASDTYGINLFASSLAIASAKGIEVLTLDKKMPFSIPDLRQQSVQSIANRMQGQRPLGMFRLNDQEFLLVFEEIGIYVDKHGDVSRAVVMEFVGRARQAALHKSMYLVLVDATSGFVEVRNANNGRLRQVISGRDVRMLDDGMAAGATTQDGVGVPVGQSRGAIKISMQHPEIERGYIVLELILNEGVND